MVEIAATPVAEPITPKKPTVWKKFLDYLVKTTNGMAFGLFATLIIGVIVTQIGNLLHFDFSLFGSTINIGTYVIALGTVLKGFMGLGIGIGVAWSLDLKGLRLISAGVVGAMSTATALVVKSDPLVCYITVVLTITLVGLIVKKKTSVDIIIIPLLFVVIGYIIAIIIDSPVSYVTTLVGTFINSATVYAPIPMGIVVAVTMGIALTLPISSAAIAIGFQISGIAGGAAVVGCCAQMLGFAVQGRRDNPIGTTIATGVGTSMIQFKNILKKPIIWLPTIIVSAILGPIATTLFQAKCLPEGAGMGTSGFVGQFATYAAMGNTLRTWLTIGVLEIALPIILVLVADMLFRKFKLYGDGDFKI
ncbi:MAG: PTS sugar transporter subunit IIC [Firmicutes bacterium]|nr:PTS sugar transporter subunit IIC [Bacillota bacterium]